MDNKKSIPFNKQLRKATREIHSVSDALVNAKLAFALGDNQVWAEGLLVFYEIFHFLEEAMANPKIPTICDMYVEGIERTRAFEEDLKFYLGENWTESYEIRPSVAKYLQHLRKLRDEEPILLIAYVYHLYMGLLSGGQILRKKRSITQKFQIFINENSGGNAVTDFGDKSVFELKKSIVNNINTIAANLTDDIKEKLLEESKLVFELNNEIIRSIKRANIIILQKLVFFLVVCIVIFILYRIIT
ncbi:hypothetical protein AAG570_006267 [Ranatra chinensis]|uniref:Heme oxygenase n=1 Tax=Ranatra chinensis TaxID=642074 RepID=A0ABD0YU51_9HEMI